MTSERIKEIQETTPYPKSVSVMIALKQVWNECQQDKNKFSEKDLREAFKQSRQANIFEKDMPPVYNEFEDWFKQFKKK